MSAIVRWRGRMLLLPALEARPATSGCYPVAGSTLARAWSRRFSASSGRRRVSFAAGTEVPLEGPVAIVDSIAPDSSREAKARGSRHLRDGGFGRRLDRCRLSRTKRSGPPLFERRSSTRSRSIRRSSASSSAGNRAIPPSTSARCGFPDAPTRHTFDTICVTPVRFWRLRSKAGGGLGCPPRSALLATTAAGSCPLRRYSIGLRRKLVREVVENGWSAAGGVCERLGDEPVGEPRVPRQERPVEIGADRAPAAGTPRNPTRRHSRSRKPPVRAAPHPDRDRSDLHDSRTRRPAAFTRLELAFEQHVADHPSVARDRLVGEEPDARHDVTVAPSVAAAEQLIPAAHREQRGTLVDRAP